MVRKPRRPIPAARIARRRTVVTSSIERVSAYKELSPWAVFAFSELSRILFLAVFFGGKWLFEVRPLTPDARLPTFQRVNPEDPRVKLQQSSVSDDDPVRDRLRKEVLDYAKALRDDPCNKTLRAHYVKAAIDYVRAWISIAPCLGTHTCRGSDSPLMDRAAHAFGSPRDLRVRDAMQAVHAKGIFGPADFPKDTVRLVADLAADGSINPAAETREFRHIKAQFGDPPQRADCGH